MNRAPHRTARRARHLRFQIMVQRVIRSLPRDVRALIDDVSIVVQEQPTEDQRRELLKHPYYELFGLYQGIPHTRRTSGYSLVAPDKITIFSGPLSRRYRTRPALERQIRITVLHELGHHLGYDELGLERIGLA